jgi:hypothetical protein
MGRELIEGGKLIGLFIEFVVPILMSINYYVSGSAPAAFVKYGGDQFLREQEAGFITPAERAPRGREPLVRLQTRVGRGKGAGEGGGRVREGPAWGVPGQRGRRQEAQPHPTKKEGNGKEAREAVSLRPARTPAGRNGILSRRRIPLAFISRQTHPIPCSARNAGRRTLTARPFAPVAAPASRQHPRMRPQCRPPGGRACPRQT